MNFLALKNRKSVEEHEYLRLWMPSFWVVLAWCSCVGFRVLSEHVLSTAFEAESTKAACAFIVLSIYFSPKVPTNGSYFLYTWSFAERPKPKVRLLREVFCARKP